MLKFCSCIDAERQNSRRFCGKEGHGKEPTTHAEKGECGSGRNFHTLNAILLKGPCNTSSNIF